jgi:hypothetical protein
MAKRNKFFKPALSVAQQVLAMASTYEGRFRVSFDRNHCVNWTGTVVPCGLGKQYQVRIVYPFRRRPEVWVVRPAIGHYENGKKVPHTFADGSICLHLHEQWNPAVSIAATIIPWLSRWLYHFEVWQAIDEWLGGGHEPSGGKH